MVLSGLTYTCDGEKMAEVNENVEDTIRRCVREEMLNFRGERTPARLGTENLLNRKPFEQNKVLDTICGVFSGKRTSKRAT